MTHESGFAATGFATTYYDEVRRSFRGYKRMADAALAQLSHQDFFHAPDPESNSAAVIVKHVAGNLRSRWKDFLTTDGEKPDRNRDQEFVLEPGDGVYFPSFVPHWVYTEGGGTSVSFSLPFYTRFGERAAYVHRFNTRLRAVGRSPRPPGTSEGIDRLKALALRSWTRLHGTARLPLPAA